MILIYWPHFFNLLAGFNLQLNFRNLTISKILPSRTSGFHIFLMLLHTKDARTTNFIFTIPDSDPTWNYYWGILCPMYMCILCFDCIHFAYRLQRNNTCINHPTLLTQCLVVSDTAQISSFPPIIATVCGFDASSSAVSQCSQHLTILTICWSVFGQFPPSPPGFYYLETQAKISVCNNDNK